MTYRETFTYRGRFVGELVIPDEDGTVTTEVSRWAWMRFRLAQWGRSLRR